MANKLEPETVSELKRRIPTLAGIKVRDQDCAKLQEIVALMREDDEEKCARVRPQARPAAEQEQVVV